MSFVLQFLAFFNFSYSEPLYASIRSASSILHCSSVNPWPTEYFITLMEWHDNEQIEAKIEVIGHWTPLHTVFKGAVDIDLEPAGQFSKACKINMISTQDPSVGQSLNLSLVEGGQDQLINLNEKNIDQDIKCNVTERFMDRYSDLLCPGLFRRFF